MKNLFPKVKLGVIQDQIQREDFKQGGWGALCEHVQTSAGRSYLTAKWSVLRT